MIQQSLFSGYHQKTREQHSRGRTRKELIVEIVGQAGKIGLTRFEITERLIEETGQTLQQNCVSSDVLELINSGAIVETDRLRRSGLGGYGKVLVLELGASADRQHSPPAIEKKPFDREGFRNATFMRLRLAMIAAKGPLNDDDLSSIEIETDATVSAAELHWRQS